MGSPFGWGWVQGREPVGNAEGCQITCLSWALGMEFRGQGLGTRSPLGPVTSADL